MWRNLMGFDPHGEFYYISNQTIVNYKDLKNQWVHIKKIIHDIFVVSGGKNVNLVFHAHFGDTVKGARFDTINEVITIGDGYVM